MTSTVLKQTYPPILILRWKRSLHLPLGKINSGKTDSEPDNGLQWVLITQYWSLSLSGHSTSQHLTPGPISGVYKTMWVYVRCTYFLIWTGTVEETPEPVCSIHLCIQLYLAQHTDAVCAHLCNAWVRNPESVQILPFQNTAKRVTIKPQHRFLKARKKTRNSNSQSVKYQRKKIRQ